MPPTTTKRVTPKKPPAAKGLESVRITLGGFGSHVIRDDWTARVSERCRRELGMPPEAVLGELFGHIAASVAGVKVAKEDQVSLDTIVRAFCFAAWQNGAGDVAYQDLLDRVTMRTEVTLEPNPEDDSPEV